MFKQVLGKGKSSYREFWPFWVKEDSTNRINHAYALAKLISIKVLCGNQSMIWLVMLTPSIEKNDSMCVDKKEEWMDPIKVYLKNKTFLKEKRQAKKVKKWLSLYYSENDQLYKRYLSLPLLLCLTSNKWTYVLRELHNGICGSHATNASMALKALRNRYF